MRQSLKLKIQPNCGFWPPFVIQHQTGRQKRCKELADVAFQRPFQMVPGTKKGFGVVIKQYSAVLCIIGWQTTSLGKSETKTTSLLKTAVLFCFFQLLALSAELDWQSGALWLMPSIFTMDVFITGFKLFFADVQLKYLSAGIHLVPGVGVMKKRVHNFMCLLLFCLCNTKPPIKPQCFILHDSRCKHLLLLALTGLLCSATYHLGKPTAFKMDHGRRSDFRLEASVIQ